MQPNPTIELRTQLRMLQLRKPYKNIASITLFFFYVPPFETQCANCDFINIFFFF